MIDRQRSFVMGPPLEWSGAWISILAIVGLVAASIRWAACGDSFWIDELHTAWCVDGPLGQVARSSERWQSTAGVFPSDVALECGQWPRFVLGCRSNPDCAYRWCSRRPASVMLIADSVYRVTGSITVGAGVGFAAAIETNHVFYGSELRPYAAIDLAVAAIVWLAVARRRDGRGGDG